jgi:hypothetical protein
VQEAGDDAKAGGLSGAVRSEQADDLTGGHMERHVLHDLPAPEGLLEIDRAQMKGVVRSRHGKVIPEPWRQRQA